MSYKTGDLMLIADAARLLGLPAATLRVWDANGKLKAMQTSGGVRLFRRDEVERMVAERDCEADDTCAS